MDHATLSSQIIAYRAEIGVSQARFAELIGVNPKTLRRLEAGIQLAKKSYAPFVTALKYRVLKAGEIPPRVKKPYTRLSHVDLPVSLKEEQAPLTALTSRYLVCIRSWKKSNPRKGAADPIETMACSLLEKQETFCNLPPFQRQCLMIGMIQGMMLKEGILTAQEALDDHNTLYYVP